MAETDVYRLYQSDESGDMYLVYVGISYDARQRFAQHRRRPFWSCVTYATITRYASREAAEIVEAHVIATEAPEFNIDAGTRRARSGDASVADLEQFIGYVEFPIGWSDREWAA